MESASLEPPILSLSPPFYLPTNSAEEPYFLYFKT